MEKQEFCLPDCWSDDVRMSALFALPRNETLNPQDWVGKFKFWRNLILEWANHYEKGILSADDLKKVFMRKGKYPASLSRVLDEMCKQGDITMKEEVTFQNDQSSWVSWGASLVKKSATWSWNKMWGALAEVDKEVIKYIVSEICKQKCEKILQHPISSSDDVLEVEDLAEQYPELFGSQEEVDVLLNELKKMGKVVIDASTETIVVKFILPTAKTNKQPQLNKSWSISPIRAKEKPVEITQADKTLATLKRTEKLVVEEIAKFEEEIKTLEQTARTKIKEGSKTGARSALYRRKQLQAVVDKRHQALLNVQTMKLQLEQAKTDSKIMEAYQIGLSALKTSFADLPLNEDKLQDTLIELEEVLEQHRDIEQTLANAVTTEETESDLEEELKNLLAEAEEEEKEAEIIFPEVPTESPIKTSVQKIKNLPNSPLAH